MPSTGPSTPVKVEPPKILTATNMNGAQTEGVAHSVFRSLYRSAQGGASLGAMYSFIPAFVYNRPFATALVQGSGIGYLSGGLFAGAFLLLERLTTGSIKPKEHFEVDHWGVAGAIIGAGVSIATGRHGKTMPHRIIAAAGGAGIGNFVGLTAHLPFIFLGLMMDEAAKKNAETIKTGATSKV